MQGDSSEALIGAMNGRIQIISQDGEGGGDYVGVYLSRSQFWGDVSKCVYASPRKRKIRRDASVIN